ncbi:hypothetical protein K458DRAFT_403484 [Lentithecium fluviatile CBS 122367]|uniref:Uncharacterized protein n=1 Tax=Lentithecium fluviatile CBS 122367 TaxID=1168545 RepID=A0A6G1J420_9PLEO|nr:hypothetical protein K458DRAFT_403484 [Lentithecium fluviatile CBS 122367]
MYNKPDDWPRRTRDRPKCKPIDAEPSFPYHHTPDRSFHSVFASHFNKYPLLNTPVEAPSFPINEPSALPSRANALIRRCAALSSTIAHLTAVADPLRSMKPSDVTNGHIFDMQQEASNVRYAFHELEAQMHEVEAILNEIKEMKWKEKERVVAGGERNVRWY